MDKKFEIVRLSSKDQDEGRQPEAMKKIGLSERDIIAIYIIEETPFTH